MVLSPAGIDYISQNFGINNCCALSGISWYYTAGGQDYGETGGTAKIVSRLASGLIESLTMINPDNGIFTQNDLDTANGSPVTLEDAQTIAKHDEPKEGQYCIGGEQPPSSGSSWGMFAVIGVIGFALFGAMLWEE